MAVERIPSRHGCQRALAVRELLLVNPTGFRLRYILPHDHPPLSLCPLPTGCRLFLADPVLESVAVDLWCAETGRQAFVQVDRYGRAWVPYFEGMSVNYMTRDYNERFYAPSDVDALCPQIFEHAVTALSADASESWGLRTILTSVRRGPFLPWTPACAGVDGYKVHLDPG